MSTKIFFLGFVVLLTIQGLSASGLSKRFFLSDVTSFVANAANNAIYTVTQDVQAAEQQAKATVQAALGNVTEAVNNGIAAAYGAVVQINNTVQGIKNTAIAVVTNATQELAAMEDRAKDDITNFLNTLKKYGNGSLNCVYTNRDRIQTVIGTAASNVITCTAAVVEQAVPILSDAVQIYKGLQDMGNKAAFITATCIPAGATFVLAAPCVLFEAVLVAGKVVSDITTITTSVNDIITKAPALKQEIQSCSATVRNATTDVNDLLKTIESCVNNFVSSNP